MLAIEAVNAPDMSFLFQEPVEQEPTGGGPLDRETIDRILEQIANNPTLTNALGIDLSEPESTGILVGGFVTATLTLSGIDSDEGVYIGVTFPQGSRLSHLSHEVNDQKVLLQETLKELYFFRM